MSIEQGKVPTNEARITPTSLLEDNQSSPAQDGIEAWQNARGRGKLLLASGCADARVDIPTFLQTSTIVEKTSIAGSGVNDGFRFLITHPGNNAILAWQHFSKYKVGDDGIFRGCGGLDAKRESISSGGIAPDVDGAHAFIRDDIHGTHVISQGYRVGLEKSQILANAGVFDKPIIAAAVDHSSGRIIPFALIKNGGRSIEVAFNLTHLFDEMDCPHLYENGEIPELDHDLLPEDVRELLERNREFVKNVGNNLAFSDAQEHQNPAAIVITTSTVPVSVRYPQTFGRPNTAFTLGLPYKKMEDGEVLTPQDLQVVMRQAEYPMMKANEKEGTDFRGTDLLIVETKSMQMSAELAHYLDEHAHWIHDWINQGERRVIIAASDEGETSAMKDFTDQLAA